MDQRSPMNPSEQTTRVVVKINPKSARKKTRKRVKTCGPEFDLYHNGNRTDSVLLRSPKTGWSGWLLLNEIEIESISK